MYVPKNATRQLVIECDIILTTPVISEWEDIRQNKIEVMDKNKQLGNKNVYRTHTEYEMNY